MNRSAPLRITLMPLLVLLMAELVFAQFGNLTRRIPDNANAIILMNVDQLMRTPLAAKEGWRADQEKAFQAGLLMVPPDVDKLVAAAQFDFETLQPLWQIMLMDLRYEPSMPKVALRFSGSVDKIEGRDVAILPGDTYAVKFSPSLAAVGLPARRQEVARWISRIDKSQLLGPSKYLNEAQSFAESTAHVIMALDLEHVLSAEAVQDRLPEMKSLRGHNVDPEAVSQAFASIRGISLGITVGEQRVGAIKVDFDQDISVLKDFAKPLLLEVLGNQGAMIDEFYEWDVEVGSKQIQLRGRLYQSGTRRLLSFLDLPPSLQQVAAQQPSADDPQSQQQAVVLASQQYFNSVTSLLDDLRSDKQGRQTMGQIGVFFRNYARKIDQLPILNVDPDLLDYGKFVSESLRQGQMEIQETAGRSRGRQQEARAYDVQTASAPIGVSWGCAYGWYGWSAQEDQRRTAQMRSNIRSQERIRGSMSANIIVQHIEDATADMRRHLTMKYQVEF